VTRIAALGDSTSALVKFSGSDNSAGTQRWWDFLVCEHLAAQFLATVPGLTAAQTSVLQAGSRTFLAAPSVQGLPGAARLLERALIDRDTTQAITWLWHFGQLIGNTDIHDGNLSFRPRVSVEATPLILAPAYCILSINAWMGAT
jgi:hypothetical protein